MKRDAREIGDYQFQLEADLEQDIRYDHPLVGQRVEISPYACESLKRHRGEPADVVGVILKHGRVVGLKVKIKEGAVFHSPKKDFFIERSMVEDVHIDTAQAEHIRTVMSHFSVQRDYMGPVWDGIELFHFELAKAVTAVGVEAAGCYKYPTSKRPGSDGQDWRLVTQHPTPVVINCHSLLHDGVWTLNTTIYSSREARRPQIVVQSKDHWQRTMMWTGALARALMTSGYDHKKTLQNLAKTLQGLARRRAVSAKLTAAGFHRVVPKIKKVYRELCGQEPVCLPFSVGVSPIRVQPNHIALYEPPSDVMPYGIVTVKPRALKDDIYLKHVVTHELIHHVLATSGDYTIHGDLFNAVAAAMGIPREFRD